MRYFKKHIRRKKGPSYTFEKFEPSTCWWTRIPGKKNIFYINIKATEKAEHRLIVSQILIIIWLPAATPFYPRALTRVTFIILGIVSNTKKRTFRKRNLSNATTTTNKPAKHNIVLAIHISWTYIRSSVVDKSKRRKMYKKKLYT